MWHTRDWISDPFLNKPPKLSPSAYEPAANCVPPGAQGRLLRATLVSFPPLTLHISKPCPQGSTCDMSPATTTSHLKSDPLAKKAPATSLQQRAAPYVLVHPFSSGLPLPLYSSLLPPCPFLRASARTAPSDWNSFPQKPAPPSLVPANIIPHPPHPDLAFFSKALAAF